MNAMLPAKRFQVASPGLFENVTAADYFADPCPIPALSQSIAKTLLERSPLHAWCEHPRLGKLQVDDEEDDAERYNTAQTIGSAAHSLMLGRGKEMAIGEFENWRTKEAKTFKSDALLAGLTPILRKHMERACSIVGVGRDIIAESAASDAFQNGSGEVVLAWEENGIWFRSLVDWLHTDLTAVDDYKTTGLSCAPHEIDKRMADAGWDIQAAMQERGLNALFPDTAGRRRFRFIVQENTPPYALVVCELPEHTLDLGRRKLNVAIAIWSDCLRSNSWPGYRRTLLYPAHPTWHERQWLDREMAEFAHLIGQPRQPVPPTLTDLSAG